MRAIEQRRLNAAIAEHDAAIREFIGICERCAGSEWHNPPAPGKWSTAAVALHICRSYEMGADAMQGGPSMRLLVSRGFSWLLRTFMLPLIFATKRFPRGANAPGEVAPDLDEASRFTREAATARLRGAAEAATSAIRRAARDRPSPVLTHAYFGTLDPYSSLRLLSAHTRHHSRLLTRE